MNRRNFLKLIPAAAAVPAILTKKKTELSKGDIIKFSRTMPNPYMFESDSEFHSGGISGESQTAFEECLRSAKNLSIKEKDLSSALNTLMAQGNSFNGKIHLKFNKYE